MSTSENDSGVKTNHNETESSSPGASSDAQSNKSTSASTAAEQSEPDSERTIAIRIGPDIQWDDKDGPDKEKAEKTTADKQTPVKKADAKDVSARDASTKNAGTKDSAKDPVTASGSAADTAAEPMEQALSDSEATVVARPTPERAPAQPPANDAPRPAQKEQPADAQQTVVADTPRPADSKDGQTSRAGQVSDQVPDTVAAQTPKPESRAKTAQQSTRTVDDPSIPALGDIDQVMDDTGPQIGSFDSADEETVAVPGDARRVDLRAKQSSAQQKDYVRKIEQAKEAVRRAVRLDENALDQSIAETRTVVADQAPQKKASAAEEKPVPAARETDAGQPTKVADKPKTKPVSAAAGKNRNKEKKAGAKDKKARKLARKQAKKQAKEQARQARAEQQKQKKQQKQQKQQKKKIETGGRKVTIVSPEAIPDTTQAVRPEPVPAEPAVTTDPVTANLDEAVTRVATQQDVTRILQRHADSPNIDAGSIRVLSFTGNGFEYFKLWIVNTLLSIITLGVYSAWAKVNLRKYLYRHTHLLNNNFDYAGDPLAILKGRVLFALGIGLAAYLATTHWIMQVVLGVIAVVVFPWLVIKVRAFNARNTSFSNVHFAFDDSRYGQAAVVHIVGMLFTIVTLGLMAPSYWYRQKKFLATGYRYGGSRFEFSARVSDFYRIFFVMISLVIGFVMGFFVLMVMAKIAVPDAVIESSKSTTSLWSLKGLAIAYAVCCVFFLKILYDTETSKLFWYSLSIRDNHFGLLIKLGRMTALYFVNVVLTLLTCGLYYPWARISLTRYKVGQLTIVVSGDVMTAIKKEQINAARKTRETPKFLGHEIGL